MKAELTFTYDADMRPVAAKCTECGEEMPTPPLDLRSAVDVIAWLSAHFLNHKRIKHSTPSSAAEDSDEYSR